MRLMIVESPNKIKKISEYLGQGWKVAASVGHIRDLPDKEMGVKPPDFKPTYVVSHEKKKVVAKLKALCKEANEVYLATDPDREGEAIAWHLAQELRLKSPKRVTFNKITKAALEKAIENAGEIDYKLVAAQEGRRVLDRIIGYTISPILSQQAMCALSAGRVQSPSLKLVVLREREIEKFRKRNFFLPMAEIGEDVELALSPKGWCEDDKHIFDRDVAEKIAAHNDLILLSNEQEDKEVRPPAPFTTSSLVQAASKYLKFSTSETMKIAQRLFEAGLITYHRTDSPNLSDEGHEEIASFARETGHEVSETKLTWASKEGAQEGHEAIRPAMIQETGDSLSGKEASLFQLIRERAIASTLVPAIDRVITISAESAETISVGEYKGKTLYRATAKSEQRAGWREVLTLEKPARPDKVITCNVTPGESITASMQIQQKTTEPPKRFTEGELVKALEKLGIGRPSTYGSIIENIKRRGYIEEQKRGKGKGLLSPTEKGMTLVDGLAELSFMNLDFTRTIEGHLDQVATGKTRYLELVKALYQNIEDEKGKVAIASPLIPVSACPSCGMQLKQLFSKKNNSHFWVHIEDNDSCQKFISDQDGAPAIKNAS